MNRTNCQPNEKLATITRRIRPLSRAKDSGLGLVWISDRVDDDGECPGSDHVNEPPGHADVNDCAVPLEDPMDHAGADDALLSQVGILAAIVYVPFLQTLFRTASLSLMDWLILYSLAPLVLVIEETRKALTRTVKRE